MGVVCIGFSDDWFSIFPNKIFGKILFLKEKICNFLLSFCKISFASVTCFFFFFIALGPFCRARASHCSIRLLLLQSVDSKAHGLSSYGTLASSVGAPGLSCPTACGACLVPQPGDQGSNQHPLHWKMDS